MTPREPVYDDIHPCFAWMRDYLRSVAPDGRLPGRQHIEPGGMLRLLPLINLIDVLRDGPALAFRYRLVGTTQTIVAGREITGLTIEEAVMPDAVARVRGNMEAAVATRRPVYDRFPMPHPGREFIDAERIYFPLAADGETVDILLILNGYPNDPELIQWSPEKNRQKVGARREPTG